MLCLLTVYTVCYLAILNRSYNVYIIVFYNSMTSTSKELHVTEFVFVTPYKTLTGRGRLHNSNWKLKSKVCVLLLCKYMYFIHLVFVRRHK